MPMIVDSVTELIGDTPLLRIPRSISGLDHIDLYAKLEMFNPFGSVKDRIAWAMLKPHLEELRASKKTVLENSSGNTAKALQAICGIYGIPFRLVSALAKIPEPKDILKLLGAEIEEIPSASDCFDPNDPNDPQYLIERIVDEDPERHFFVSQFTNEANPDEHYRSTGKELLDDLGSIDYLVGGLGTSGSTLGAARKIREECPELFVLGLTAQKYDFIPGIRTVDEMWETGIYRESEYNEIRQVSSAVAIDGMLRLIRGCGILCGPTSGANFSGALEKLKEVDSILKVSPPSERKKAVFIVCDRVEWYTSYIKKRRPEIYREPARGPQLHSLSLEEIEEAPHIRPEDVLRLVKERNLLLVDVRSKVAFELGSLPGAVNIPLEMLEVLIESGSPFEKNRPLVLICQIGTKTRAPTAFLCQQGFDCYHLQGGVKAWLSGVSRTRYPGEAYSSAPSTRTAPQLSASSF
jgi:S-sulfo-L-cysteine synthase (O-acetyl-L-serine-dependent)